MYTSKNLLNAINGFPSFIGIFISEDFGKLSERKQIKNICVKVNKYVSIIWSYKYHYLFYKPIFDIADTVLLRFEGVGYS